MLIPPKNTVYKLAKGAENPSVDLVSTMVRALEKECTGQKSPASSGVNGHQVGDVKSSAAVGRTSTSARLRYGADLKLYCGLAFAALTTKRRQRRRELPWSQLVWRM